MTLSSPPAPRLCRQGAAVAALLLLACFLLYGPRWLAGLSLFRGVVQEQYYLLGQFAFDHRIRSDFAAGFFPLWNHLNALGTPLLGNMLSGVFYPLKIIIYLVPSLPSRDFYLVLRLLLAGLGAFALARHLRLSPGPAAVAALSFAFTGYMKMFVNENYLNADILLPFLLLFTFRLFEKGRTRDVVLLALLVFAVLNNGHPEAAFYTLLLPAWAALTEPAYRRRLLLAAGGAALGFLLSLPLLLPFLEYWFRGWHFHIPGAGFFHYSVRQLAAIVSPWFYGPAPAGAPFLFPPQLTWPSEPPLLPDSASTTVPWLIPGLGAVPVFLLLIGVSRPARLSRREGALLLYALFFLGVMFGLPIFRLIGLVPPFSFSGNFKHPLPGVALAAALLAGRGAELILRRAISPRRLTTLLLLFLAGLLLFGFFSEPLPSQASYLNSRSFLLLLLVGVLGMWVVRVVPSSGAARARGGRLALSNFVINITIISSALAALILDGLHQPMRDLHYEAQLADSRALRFLSEERPLSRVYISPEIFPPNLNLLFDLADIRVMDGINDRRLVQAINRLNDHDRAEAGTYWYQKTGYLQPMPERLGHPLLSLFNVEYAITRGPLPYHQIQDLLEQPGTAVVAPSSSHVGSAVFPWGKGTAPALYQHPPSRLTLPPAPAASSQRALYLRFRPAVLSSALCQQPDGVWFLAAAGERLIYCRHLHPRSQPADERVPVMEVPVRGEGTASAEVRLFTLPGPTPDYDQVGWVDFRRGPKEEFDPAPWEEKVEDEPRLYFNPAALPRLFVVPFAERVAEEEALSLLAEGEVDPRQTVLISSPKELNLPGGSSAPGLPGRIESVEYGPQRLTVQCRLWEPGWLVLADLYYPGWQVWVDGKERRVYQADYCLRAVPLDKGEHELVMRYVPASFRLGLNAVLGTIFFLLTVPLFGRRFLRRQR